MLVTGLVILWVTEVVVSTKFVTGKLNVPAHKILICIIRGDQGKNITCTTNGLAE